MIPVAERLPAVQSRPGCCATHGEFEDRGYALSAAVLWRGCPVCCDARIKASQEVRTAARADEIIGQAAIPARFQRCTLDGYRTDDAEQIAALAIVRKWIGTVTTGATGTPLVLAGNPGRGKTHLATAAMREIARTDRSCQYAKSIQIEDAIRRGDAAREVRARWASVWMLVVDELGMESGNEFTRAGITSVLHDRYDSMLPTVIATNLTSAALRERYGNGIFDRFVRGAQIVVFKAESERGR